MNHATKTILFSLGCALLFACEAQDEFDDADELSEVEEIHADEVLAQLEQDPDRIFFVDLRDDTLYHFVQPEADIPFDHFLVQCPSMPAPVPMLDLMSALEVEVTAPD